MSQKEFIHVNECAQKYAAHRGMDLILFTTFDKDGNVDICGGIIYHGNPKNGYKEAGSVLINPSYGWHIHT